MILIRLEVKTGRDSRVVCRMIVETVLATRPPNEKALRHPTLPEGEPRPGRRASSIESPPANERNPEISCLENLQNLQNSTTAARST